MSLGFYKAFENKYRGSRDLIKSRLQVYVPFIKPLMDGGEKGNVKAIDLGCGRGEWLEILEEQEFNAFGVDLDEDMYVGCSKKGFQVEKVDALEYLRNQKSDSVSLISGFHLAEHLMFEDLQELVCESLRVLKAGGLLILETPNPENIIVGTTSFYLDPTHQKPLPPLLLSFIAEHSGFDRIKQLRLQEDKSLSELTNPTLLDVLIGVSPDYAIIAQKNANESTMAKFELAFSNEYGISLHEVVRNYDNNLKNNSLNIQNKLEEMANINQQMDLRAQQAEARSQYANKLAQQAEARYQQANERASQLDERARLLDTKKQEAEDIARQYMEQYDQSHKWGEEIHNRLILANQKIIESENVINSIYISTSWQLTKPVRFLKRLLLKARFTRNVNIKKEDVQGIEVTRKILDESIDNIKYDSQPTSMTPKASKSYVALKCVIKELKRK